VHGFALDAIGFAIFAIASTIAGTALIYAGLELPMLRFLQRIYRRARPAPNALGPSTQGPA
jgi:hypothetical protein